MIKARELTEKIDKRALDEVKNYKIPNEKAILALEPVNILFGKEPGWKSTLQLLAQRKNLKDDMRKYDIQQVTPEMLEKMQVYTQNPNYVPATIKKASHSCGIVATWVLAIQNAAILHLNLPQKSSHYD